MILLLVFILFGCSNKELLELVTVQLDEAKSLVEQKDLPEALKILEELEIILSEEKEDEYLSEVQQEIQRVKDLIRKEREQNSLLAKVLIDISDDYGYIPTNHQFHDVLGDLGLGIVYADLIDFNNDGRSELYVLFRSSDYASDELSHRNQRGYIEEVWGVQGKEPILLKQGMYDYEDVSYASDLALSFITLEDGTVAIRHNHEKTGQGIHNSVNTYYTLSDSIFVEKRLFQSSGSSFENLPPEFYIDDKLVDEQTFELEKQKFEGTEQQVFISHAGTKEFVIDLSETKKQVMEIVSLLTSENNSALLEKDAVQITPELTNAFNIFKNLGNVNVLNKDLYPSMLIDLIHNEYITDDAPGYEFYGTAYTKANIQSAMKKYFNIEVNPKTFGFSTDLSSFDYLVYHNDVLYLIGSDSYDDYKNIYTPEKVVQVADNLYYAKVGVKAFDVWAFFESYYEVDYSEFLDLPLEKWPDFAKPFVENRLPSYLLMKKSEDGFQLLYQGKYNLTDEELEEFK